jgi:hypothetical protein
MQYVVILAIPSPHGHPWDRQWIYGPFANQEIAEKFATGLEGLLERTGGPGRPWGYRDRPMVWALRNPDSANSSVASILQTINANYEEHMRRSAVPHPDVLEEAKLHRLGENED